MARRKVAILTLFSTVFAPVLVVPRTFRYGPVSSKQRVRRDNCRIGDIFIVRGFRSTVSERSAETVRFDRNGRRSRFVPRTPVVISPAKRTVRVILTRSATCLLSSSGSVQTTNSGRKRLRCPINHNYVYISDINRYARCAKTSWLRETFHAVTVELRIQRR